jgi:stage III sporulation protein AF
MDFLREVILSVTVAALIVALAEAVTPPGGVKKAARLTGGLVLMFGLLQPLVRTDFEELFAAANAAAEITVASPEEMAANETEFLKSIIEKETEAYVLDKARSLGIVCLARITCQTGENNIPYPVSALVEGDLDAGARSEIAAILSGDLGIPPENQILPSGDVT